MFHSGGSASESGEPYGVHTTCMPSAEVYSYRDTEMFIDALGEGRVAARLARAIQGRGAFRRFKDVLADSDDLLARWYGFSDDRHRGRARAWLADQGYTPIPTRPDPDA